VKTGKVDGKCVYRLLYEVLAVRRDTDKGTWLTETVWFGAGF